MTLDPATLRRYEDLYTPVLREIEERSAVADAFIDKELYRIYVATLWANVVSRPEGAGLTEDELEVFYDFLGSRIEAVLGPGQEVLDCFRFVVSTPGQRALERHRLTRRHRNLLHYFASLMLDPDGHRQRMERDSGR